ncbi:hypothetical protein HPB51_029422 [Rhipicephalus microplus]|uniref:Uncharacterized protein n=1 Tax=Rhipicephalus microplus TaxID=6941 RepID=A0A9J6CUY1_RHIMP|nr:hypothetical protein HPB51_029422 [Rhipicephalus microplus]
MAVADEDEDFSVALELHLQINEENEYRESLLTWDRPSTKAPVERSVVPYSSRRDLSVVDDFWELNDPNPDLRSLFVEFNEAFFFGKLSHVEVRWSPRMTLQIARITSAVKKRRKKIQRSRQPMCATAERHAEVDARILLGSEVHASLCWRQHIAPK